MLLDERQRFSLGLGGNHVDRLLDSWFDAQLVKQRPQPLHGSRRAAEVLAAADTPERPADSFEFALPNRIIDMLLDSMKRVAVAFDSEALRNAFHNQVEPVAADPVLRSDPVAALGQIEVHALREQTVEGGMADLAPDLTEVEKRCLVWRP